MVCALSVLVFGLWFRDSGRYKMVGWLCSAGNVILLLGFLLFFGCCQSYADEASFDEVVRGYAESIKKLRNVSFSYHLETFFGERFYGETSGTILTDQKNIRHRFNQQVAENGQVTHHEDIIAPEWDRFLRIVRNDQGEPVVISCHNIENIPDINQTLGPMNFIFGRLLFQGFAYLPDMAKELGAINVALFNDSGRIEISFVHQNYQYRILLDSESFALRFFEKESITRRTEAYETVRYSIEILESQNINGMIFPTKFVVAHSMSGDGTEHDNTMHRYALTNVSFSSLSEKDFHLSITLPNGIPAEMQDAPQIQYIWYDGKIVPKTDEVMLAIARGGHKFMPGPSEPRFWFMSIGIILILIACGRLAYKHFTNKA